MSNQLAAQGVPADLVRAAESIEAAVGTLAEGLEGHLEALNAPLIALRAALAATTSPAQAQQATHLFVQPVSGDKLWLWQDGHKLLAYRHEYPCYSPGGDPCTLGEPVAVAEYRESYDR